MFCELFYCLLEYTNTLGFVSCFQRQVHNFVLSECSFNSSRHESIFNMPCQEDYKPAHWLPLLQATVAGARMKEESEAAISLQLLATVAEVGEEDVAPHVPEITAAVQGEICQHIPPHPEPWPMVIKLCPPGSKWYRKIGFATST